MNCLECQTLCWTAHQSAEVLDHFDVLDPSIVHLRSIQSGQLACTGKTPRKSDILENTRRKAVQPHNLALRCMLPMGSAALVQLWWVFLEGSHAPSHVNNRDDAHFVTQGEKLRVICSYPRATAGRGSEHINLEERLPGVEVVDFEPCVRSTQHNVPRSRHQAHR